MKTFYLLMVTGAAAVLLVGGALWTGFCKVMKAWAEASEPAPSLRYWR